MGEVYRARDVRLEREVAVKVLASHLEGDAQALERFEREARAVASLSHPNIVAIHDFGTTDDRPFTVTELLRGESLRDRLGRGPLPWRQAAEVAIAICDGLSAAHGRGIVHRDLKPENLYLTDDERVKILDFGLASMQGTAEGVLDQGETRVAITSSGTILGTLGYMSPEQARGLPVGPTSDVFSLGCVLFEMLTGRPPFHRPTGGDTLAAVLNDEPPSLSGSGEHGPPELQRIVRHCLGKHPASRFQSTLDLAFALRALLADSSVEHPPARRGRTGPRRKLVAVLPFVNAAEDPDAEFVADALTENVINHLARLEGVHVVARSVMFRYKGRELDPRTAAVELGATWLLTGRLAQRHDTLHIQAELVDTQAASQLWGQRFSVAADRLFDVQDRVAGEIVEGLRGRLGRGRPKKPSRAAAVAVDPEAHRHYLRGRHHWSKWSREGFARAAEEFHASIAADPTFARAYAGLADAYGAAAYYGFLPPDEAFPRSEAAAERALLLEPTLAEAHATKGVARMFRHWDMEGAGASFERALALDPQYAPGHVYRALYLAVRRRNDEALAAAKRAEELDPLSLLTLTGVAWMHGMRGDAEQARSQAYRALQLDPTFAEAAGIVVFSLERLGRFREAAPKMREWLALAGLPAELAEGLDEAAGQGAQAYWEAKLHALERVPCTGSLAHARAAVQAQLGDADGMFASLEACVAERLPWLVFLDTQPVFEPYRDDPVSRRWPGASGSVRSPVPRLRARCPETGGRARAASAPRRAPT
jgi:eukaryotic-like serine/threonine-protein kinase